MKRKVYMLEHGSQVTLYWGLERAVTAAMDLAPYGFIGHGWANKFDANSMTKARKLANGCGVVEIKNQHEQVTIKVKHIQ